MAAKKRSAAKSAGRKKSSNNDMRYYTTHVSNRAGEVFKKTEKYYFGPEIKLDSGATGRMSYTAGVKTRKTRYR
jgi:hypothetical protein